jgi:transposase InsO family protein
VKVIADTLGVARSNLIEQLARPKPRGSYRRQGDDELLTAIRQLTDARPTYGYRRITALLNRARRASGADPVNHKGVFRLMAQSRLLLQPHVGQRPVRAHEGRVIASASNQRWSSDGLEIGCWNGEVVRVVFAIDTCDREVIAWQASTGGISGEMVRDLMLACVERRFNALRAPHRVQWLSDNGSAYVARDTLDFAATLSLMPRFTPVRSPESNGISEAFVKTLKRDYARVQPRPDALTVLAQLPVWIEDYNENHPHRGLRMKSPREFIRQQLSSQATAEAAHP